MMLTQLGGAAPRAARLRSPRVEWGNGPPVTVFTNTMTKGDSDHVNQFSCNHGTNSEPGSADVDLD
jgi:hypothetical protein